MESSDAANGQTPEEIGAMLDATPEPRVLTGNSRTLSRIHGKWGGSKGKSEVDDGLSDGVLFIKKGVTE